MKIEFIEVKGFGRLRELSWRLLPSINLFVGGNESGKSTLQQAILAALYGFFEGDRRPRRVETRQRQRFFPWGGPPYACTIEYLLDTGEKYRIHRSFESIDVPTQIFNLIDGRDVTRQFGIGRHGNMPAAVQRQRLGMTKQVFVNSSFVSQRMIDRIEQPGSVREALVSMSDTASPDVSASKAVDWLTKALSKKVGGPRAYTTALPLAMGRLDAARAELRKLEKAHEGIRRDAEEKQQREGDARTLREGQRRLSLLISQKRLEETESRLGKLAKMNDQLRESRNKQEELKGYSGFPVELRDRILKEKGTLDNLSNEVDGLRRQWDEVSPQLEQVKGRIRQVRDDMAALEYARDFPANRKDEFDSLRIVRGRAIESLSNLEGKKHALETDLQVATKRILSPRTMVYGSLVAAAAILVVSALAKAVVPGLLGAVLAVLIGVVVSRFLGPPRKMQEQLTNLQGKIAERTREIGHTEAQLRGLLGEVSIAAESLEAGIVAFSQRFQDRNYLLEYEKDLALLLEKRKGLASMLNNLQEKKEDARASEGRLKNLLAQAGLVVVNIEETLREFEDACDRRVRYNDLERETRSVKAQRTVLLADRTETELASLRQRLEKDIMATVASFPMLKGLATNKTLQELENQEETVAQQLADAEKDVRGLGERIRATLSHHRSRAEVEEDLSRYENEVRRLEHFASALSMAVAVIGEAAEEVHRDIAPRLNKEVGDALGRITGGRYAEVYVDPTNLEVSLKSPEIDEIVSIDRLSLGTQQQVYLLLRVAIARLLSATGERIPLILDDPFVDFDEPRLLRTLDLLVDISERNQVLLFTKSALVQKWFKTNLGDASRCRVFCLPAP